MSNSRREIEEKLSKLRRQQEKYEQDLLHIPSGPPSPNSPNRRTRAAMDIDPATVTPLRLHLPSQQNVRIVNPTPVRLPQHTRDSDPVRRGSENNSDGQIRSGSQASSVLGNREIWGMEDQRNRLGIALNDITECLRHATDDEVKDYVSVFKMVFSNTTSLVQRGVSLTEISGHVEGAAYGGGVLGFTALSRRIGKELRPKLTPDQLIEGRNMIHIQTDVFGYDPVTKIHIMNCGIANIRAQNYATLQEWVDNPDHLYVGRILGFNPAARPDINWGVPWRDNRGANSDGLVQYYYYVKGNPELYNKLPELYGKWLGDYSRPGISHGDILILLLKEYMANSDNEDRMKEVIEAYNQSHLMD